MKLDNGAIYPPEMLTVPDGQIYFPRDTLSQEVHSAVLDYTRVTREDHPKLTREFFSLLGLDNSRALKDFGIKIHQTPVQVQREMLLCPDLHYLTNTEVKIYSNVLYFPD